MTFLKQADVDKLYLYLHVQPRASKTKIVGVYDGRLKIAVKSPPADGKANKEIQRFLAKLFGLATRDLRLKSGLQSRQKVVEITLVSMEQVKALIEKSL